jgi:hypothetical protein
MQETVLGLDQPMALAYWPNGPYRFDWLKPVGVVRVWPRIGHRAPGATIGGGPAG